VGYQSKSCLSPPGKWETARHRARELISSGWRERHLCTTASPPSRSRPWSLPATGQACDRRRSASVSCLVSLFLYQVLTQVWCSTMGYGTAEGSSRARSNSKPARPPKNAICRQSHQNNHRHLERTRFRYKVDREIIHSELGATT